MNSKLLGRSILSFLKFSVMQGFNPPADDPRVRTQVRLSRAKNFAVVNIGHMQSRVARAAFVKGQLVISDSVVIPHTPGEISKDVMVAAKTRSASGYVAIALGHSVKMHRESEKVDPGTIAQIEQGFTGQQTDAAHSSWLWQGNGTPRFAIKYTVEKNHINALMKTAEAEKLTVVRLDYTPFVLMNALLGHAELKQGKALPKGFNARVALVCDVSAVQVLAMSAAGEWFYYRGAPIFARASGADASSRDVYLEPLGQLLADLARKYPTESENVLDVCGFDTGIPSNGWVSIERAVHAYNESVNRAPNRTTFQLRQVIRGQDIDFHAMLLHP